MTHLDRSILFNNCTGCEAPDFTRYSRLELGGCIDHNGDTESGVDRDNAEFFTVYGRLKDSYSEVEAITDIPANRIGHKMADASIVAVQLAALFNLPLRVAC